MLRVSVQKDRVFSFYQGLCKHLQTVVPVKDEAGEAWLDAVDARCEVHELRTYLLTHDVTPEVLQAVLQRHLERKARAGSEDNKLDLLLVHYLAQSMSRSDTDMTFAKAVELLKPVLGPMVATAPPAALTLRDELAQTNEVRDLLERNLLQKLHQLRAQRHDASVASLALFAWLSLVVRRTCVRLVMSDLDSIEKNCHLLRPRGIAELQSGTVGQQRRETLDDLERKCGNWRRPFPGKYYDDSWFREIAAWKEATEAALGNTESNLEPATPSPLAESRRDEAGAQPEPVRSSAPEPVPPPAAGSLPAGAREEHKPAPTEAPPPPQHQRMAGLITEALKSVHSADFARIQVGKAAVILSSAEIRAFRFAGEPASPLLQEMVIARADLAEALRNADAPTMERAKAAAEKVLHAARTAVAEMEQKHNSEMSINLQSSARALEKALGQHKAAKAGDGR